MGPMERVTSQLDTDTYVTPSCPSLSIDNIVKLYNENYNRHNRKKNFFGILEKACCQVRGSNLHRLKMIRKQPVIADIFKLASVL